MAITVYDTTLREGIQSSGLWLTVEDKLKIVRLLDRLGVHYIEAGNPAANQKDAMFFQRARGLKLHHAKECLLMRTRTSKRFWLPIPLWSAFLASVGIIMWNAFWERISWKTWDLLPIRWDT